MPQTSALPTKLQSPYSGFLLPPGSFDHCAVIVDPKGIEPSTLSLQGRNASLGTCKPIIFVGEEGFEPPAFLMYRIYSPTPIRHLSSSPNCPSQTSFYEEKKMVDRLLCYSEHFCIINVRFSILSSKQDSNLRSPHPGKNVKHFLILGLIIY